MDYFFKRQKRLLQFSISLLMLLVIVLTAFQLPKTLKTTGALLDTMSEDILTGLEHLDQMKQW